MSDTQEDEKPSPEGDGDKKDKKPEKTAPPSLPEKVTFGVTVLLVVSLAVFLGWHGWHGASPGSPEAAPRIRAQVNVRRAVPQDQGWAVPITVENRGNTPVREVVVKADVTDTDGKPGEREVTFGVLAEGASETGYVTTFADPVSQTPTVTVQSFQTEAEARGY